MREVDELSEEERKALRIRLQLIEWCNGLRADLQDYFSGSQIAFNSKVKAMAEMNNVDVKLLRRFVFLWWSSMMTKDVEEKKAISEQLLSIASRIAEEVDKNNKGRMFGFRIG